MARPRAASLPRPADRGVSPLRQGTPSRLILQDPVAHRAAAQHFGSAKDGVNVEAVVAVELANRARLSEVLNAQRTHPVAEDAADPGQRLRVGVRYGHDRGIAR